MDHYLQTPMAPITNGKFNGDWSAGHHNVIMGALGQFVEDGLIVLRLEPDFNGEALVVGQSEFFIGKVGIPVLGKNRVLIHQTFNGYGFVNKWGGLIAWKLNAALGLQMGNGNGGRRGRPRPTR
jgi:hypothetical protein